MSLHGFQSALAHVLRSYGQQGMPSLDELTTRYNLKEPEIFQLQHVLNQNGLKSYGEQIYHARWHFIEEGMGFLIPVIGDHPLQEIWDSFESKSLNVLRQEIGKNFLRYLLENEEATKKIQEESVFYARALVQYAYCIFNIRSMSSSLLKVANNSLLTGRYFMVQDLDYDVREVFSALSDEKGQDIVPPKKALTLLFIAGAEPGMFRSFEIDAELKEFLLDQLGDDPGKVAVPSCFDDLCLMGVCKR